MASSTAVAVLQSMGRIRANQLELDSISQVQTIYAPAVAGAGDLVLAGSGYGRVKVTGGLDADLPVQAPVMELGVWNDADDIDGSSIAARIAGGALMTGVKIPVIGANALQAGQVYTLRAYGTSGHLVWANADSYPGTFTLEGALEVDNAMSVAGDATFIQDVSVGGIIVAASNVSVGGNLYVSGSTISTTDIAVDDISIVLNQGGTTDASAQNAGFIIRASSISGDADRSILYTTAANSLSTGSTQMSAFKFSDDILLDVKTRPSGTVAALDSKLATSKRSKALHLGNPAGDHFMIVADEAAKKLRFFYGTDVSDAEVISAITTATEVFSIDASNV